jgi:hypothetical protein
MPKVPAKAPAHARVKNKIYTGRFVLCPASYFSHTQLVGCEVQLGKSFFALCPFCTTRMFLNTWEEGQGYTIHDLLDRGGVAPAVTPQRQQELLATTVPAPKRASI